MSLEYNTPIKLLALGKGYLTLNPEPYGQASVGPYEYATTFTPYPFPASTATSNMYLLESDGNCLGRAEAEDLSLRPKSIISVPGLNDGVCKVMVVEREYEGGFTMRVGNGRVVVIEDRVFASIVADEPPSSVFRGVY